jgi:hypothetical protein
VTRMFKPGKRKGIKERKLALINQLNQINNQLHNIVQLDNRDYVYRPVQAVEYTDLSQSSSG